MKQLFYSISILLLSVTFLIARDWVSFESGTRGNSSPANAALSASPVGESGLKVSFTLAGCYFEKSVLNNENWQSISFPNQCVTDEVGAPGLPLMRRYFAVPKNAAVKVEVTDVVFETFENVKIKPFQRPLLETETAKDREFAINENLYKTDRFYPNEWATSTESVVMRGVQMGILKINPFRYNPVTGKVQAASEITCKVTWINPNPGVVMTFPSNLKNTFKALLLNFDFMEYRKVPCRSKLNLKKATDYLMICDPDLIDNAGLQSLADLYTSQGYTVELKDVTELGSSSSDIMDYIQSLYDGGELDYVLLVGDLPAIPHYETRTESDSWYSWLDGNDKIGDIGLGRMPATDETELNYMVTKTLDFQTGAEPGEWRKKSVLIAHKENYPDKYTACKNDIFEHDYTLDVPTMDKCYGGENGTNDDITDAINEGRLVVNYRGHGSSSAWTGWNGSSYSTSNASDLENGKKTPIVYMMACTNGKISSSSHCLAEAFMCQEQGGVWVLAATTTSLTSVNHHYDRGLYYGAWDEGIETVGDLRNYADAWALEQSGSSANSNITMYVCFGDPLINLLYISNVPYLTISAPASGEEVEKNFKYNIKWGDNISGNVKIELLKAGNVVYGIAGSIESNGLFEWDVPGNLPVGSDYQIRITSIDSSALFDETNGFFSIIEERIYTIPYFQDFNNWSRSTTDFWEQGDDDDLNWTILSGPTPSRDGGYTTGPEGDFPNGSGQYIYIEASGSNYPSKKASIITPKFDFQRVAEAKLRLYYHMYSGENVMGDFFVDVQVGSNSAWEEAKISLTGNDYGDNWIEQQLDLAFIVSGNYTAEQKKRVRFRLRGITSDDSDEGWSSDICVDSFSIDNVTTGIIEGPKNLTSFDLQYHNSRIRYRIPDLNKKIQVSIRLYNIQGKQIRTLVNEEKKPGSSYYVELGTNAKKLAAGVYLCKMNADSFSKTIKFIKK